MTLKMTDYWKSRALELADKIMRDSRVLADIRVDIWRELNDAEPTHTQGFRVNIQNVYDKLDGANREWTDEHKYQFPDNLLEEVRKLLDELKEDLGYVSNEDTLDEEGVKSADDREYDSNDVNSEIEEEADTSGSDEQGGAGQEEDGDSTEEEPDLRESTREAGAGVEEGADGAGQGTKQGDADTVHSNGDGEVNAGNATSVEEGQGDGEGDAPSRKRSLAEVDDGGNKKRQKTSDGDGVEGDTAHGTDEATGKDGARTAEVGDNESTGKDNVGTEEGF